MFGAAGSDHVPRVRDCTLPCGLPPGIPTKRRQFYPVLTWARPGPWACRTQGDRREGGSLLAATPTTRGALRFQLKGPEAPALFLLSSRGAPRVSTLRQPCRRYAPRGPWPGAQSGETVSWGPHLRPSELSFTPGVPQAVGSPESPGSWGKSWARLLRRQSPSGPSRWGPGRFPGSHTEPVPVPS